MTDRPYHIYLATDHAGFLLKDNIKDWLVNAGYAVTDFGAHEYDAVDDFPDYIKKAAMAVSKQPATSRGIIFGGSGQGEAMVANRFPNVRATVYYGGNDDIILLSRQHNDANMLSIGARFVTVDEARRVIDVWLSTDFHVDEKYERRNRKIEKVLD